MKKIIIILVLTFFIIGCSNQQYSSNPDLINKIIADKNKEINELRAFYKNHVNECINIYLNKNTNQKYPFVFTKDQDNICIKSEYFNMFIHLLGNEDENLNNLFKCLNFE